MASTVLLGYVYPPGDSAEGADVVFVLGLVTTDRLAVAREISNEHGDIPIYVSEPHRREWVCDQPDIACVVPDPATTKGEADVLREITASEGFSRPVVVTFGPQVVRARYIFDRCSVDGVAVVRSDEPISLPTLIRQIGYQALAMVKAIATPCAQPESEPVSASGSTRQGTDHREVRDAFDVAYPIAT